MLQNIDYCGFFQWIDPPICARATEIISQLRNSIMESKNDSSKLTEKVAKVRNKNFALKKENEEMRIELLRRRAEIVKLTDRAKYWFQVAKILVWFIIGVFLFMSVRSKK